LRTTTHALGPFACVTEEGFDASNARGVCRPQRRQLARENLEARLDERERVVDLVCHTCRQRSERREPFGDDELLL
jgi:hypothetical protein